MKNVIKLKVEFSKKTKNGNFFNKLVGENTQETFLGLCTSKVTYYMFTNQKNKKNLEGELDLSNFKIVDKLYETEDEDTGKDLKITLKYLYPKVS